MTVLAEADDTSLLALIREGDAQAMAELWSRHYPATLAAARRISRQPKDAEEFASDAFSGMLQALSNDAGPSASVRGYLLTAVRNQATNRARRASTGDVLTDEITDFEDTDRELADPVAHHAELGLVREAFATLPPRWQIVLWRSAVDHEKNTVIAAELGRSPNAVAALARRARLGFRTAYLRAHGSTHGIAAECEPYVARLVELLPSTGISAAPEVREHVEECPHCARRLADLRVVDADLGAILLPALLSLGPGIAWVTGAAAAGTATHAVGGAFWLKWGRSAGQGRKLAVVGTAAAVTVAATASAYALTKPESHESHSAATHSVVQSTSAPRGTADATDTRQDRPVAAAHTARKTKKSATTSTASTTSRGSSSSAARSSRPASTRSPGEQSSKRAAPVSTATSTSRPQSTSKPDPTHATTTSPVTRTTKPSSTHTKTSTTSPTSTATSTSPPWTRTTTPPLPTPTETTSPPCWIFCWIFD